MRKNRSIPITEEQASEISSAIDHLIKIAKSHGMKPIIYFEKINSNNKPMNELKLFQANAEEAFCNHATSVENLIVGKKLQGDNSYLFYVSALLDCKLVAGSGTSEGKAVSRAIESLKDYEGIRENIVID